MRSAEKSRQSTCKLADAVATLSISEYKRRLPPFLNYDQTVLASIVLQTPDMNNPFHVVAFGVGTKVLSAEVMCLSRMDKFPSYHEIVRDCHAEVLARRSFIAYLHSITKLQLYKLNNQFFKEDIESIHFPFEMTSEGLFKLRDGYSFHFYTSSQPCGNATIKRWAKCKKSRQYDLPIHTYPQSLHDHLPVQLTAIKEGQTALFVKNNYHNDSLFQDSNLLKNASKNFIELAMTSNTSHTKELSIVRMDSSLIPSGLSLVNARKGCIMSCSDKIAKWNTLGWQGALLSNIFEPIYMSTIIVGRKFSKAHCERAFCCRIRNFSFPQTEYENYDYGLSDKKSDDHNIKYRVHHPAMLCTGIKFDESAIMTFTGSNYDSRPFQSSYRLPESFDQNISSNKNLSQLKSIVNNNNGNDDDDDELKHSVCGARFLESRCLAWYYGYDDVSNFQPNDHGSEMDSLSLQVNTVNQPSNLVHIIDGITGLSCNNFEDEIDSKVSFISSKSLFISYIRLIRSFLCLDINIYEKEVSWSQYRNFKYSNQAGVGCAMYQSAKQYLLSSPHYFSDWIRKDDFFSII